MHQIATDNAHLQRNLLVNLWVHQALARSDSTFVSMDSESLATTDAIKCQNRAMCQQIHQSMHWVLCYIGELRQLHRLGGTVRNYTNYQRIIHQILDFMHIYGFLLQNSS